MNASACRGSERLWGELLTPASPKEATLYKKRKVGYITTGKYYAPHRYFIAVKAWGLTPKSAERRYSRKLDRALRKVNVK